MKAYKILLSIEIDDDVYNVTDLVADLESKCLDYECFVEDSELLNVEE